MSIRKLSLDDLAIFGGQAGFEEKLHVGRPNLGEREKFLQRVNDLLDRRWFSNNGPYVQELESRLANMLGVKHCLLACNGTVSLELAIKACGLAGEVIVPSFTFVATAHALQWLGIQPVFCDIDPHTHTIDPARIERLITPRTTGILGVHLWGRPCAIQDLSEIAQAYDFRLLFDAAHAFLCSYQGRMIGQFGDAEVFSFHATKFMNTFEGGAVTTNDDVIARQVRLMRNFGFDGYDNVVSPGINAKMSEVHAAMGLSVLENLDEIIETNRRNYHQYWKELAGLPGLRMLAYDETEKGNFQYIVLENDSSMTGIRTGPLVQLLHVENILARRYYYPGCHRMAPYKSAIQAYAPDLPHTEVTSEKVFCLPTGTAIGPLEIQGICGLLQFVIRHGIEIQARVDRLP